MPLFTASRSGEGLLILIWLKSNGKTLSEFSDPGPVLIILPEYQAVFPSFPPSALALGRLESQLVKVNQHSCMDIVDQFTLSED